MYKKSILYSVTQFILLSCYSIFVRTCIEGEHFLPRTGPAVIVSNHISYFDPFAMAYLARRRKRQIHFLTKSELFSNLFTGWFLRRCRQIPVYRGTSNAADSLHSAKESLQQNQIVGIYPESTIAQDQVQLPIKSGALRLAIETGAPIIVIGTWGAHKSWTKGKKIRLHFRQTHWIIVREGYTLDSNTDLEKARTELAKNMLEATKSAQRKLDYDQ